MNYNQYINLFDDILNNKSSNAIYSDARYLNYAKLNEARMSRWQKTLQLNSELLAVIKAIKASQTWVIITEHWCGDAAPAVPFLVRLAEQNPLIQYDLQLRDSPPFLINDYLTNGTKSIPKLIVLDENNHDLFTWGPRPDAAQKFLLELKKSGLENETVKLELQNWYNKDKGQSLQQELLELFNTSST